MNKKFGKAIFLTLVGALFLMNFSLAAELNSNPYLGNIPIGGSTNTAQGYVSSWSYPSGSTHQAFGSNKSNVSNYGAWVAISERIDGSYNYRYLITDSKPVPFGNAFVSVGLWDISYPKYRVDWKISPLRSR